MLREVYGFWKYESLDGVFSERAVKTALGQVELAGLCILISDQTLTPYHVHLRWAADADEIEGIDCRLGAIRDGGLVRIPHHAERRGRWSIVDRLDSIEWQFHVGFGEVSVGT